MFSLIPLPGKNKVIFAVVFHEDSGEDGIAKLEANS
jgi:hypothetical protein